MLSDLLSSPSTQCTEWALEEPEEVVEKPLERPIEPLEETLEVVGTHPEPAIEEPLAPFIEPQPVPRVRMSQRTEELNDDLPVVCPRPDERYERPPSLLLLEERRSDGVSRKKTDEDLFVAFMHLNESH